MKKQFATFYIMKAAHLTSSGRKLGLKKIMKDEPNCTIIVASRQHGYSKVVPCFIIGSPSNNNYNVTSGQQCTHTIDTGCGHRNENQPITIETVLQVRDGKITNNVDISQIENRYTFVMK